MAFNWDAAKTKKDYNKLEKADIINYCREHDKMEWLKQAAIDLKKEEQLRAEKAKEAGKKPREFGVLQLRNKFIKEVLNIGAKSSANSISLYDEIMNLFNE